MKQMVLAFACASVLLSTLPTDTRADPLYVADNEVGVPLIGELAQDFSVLGQILLPAGPITSVAAGPAGHVFASTATKVYDFSSSGTLLNTFSGFANSGFADLSFNGQVLYVADNEVGVPLIGELAQNFSVLGQILLPAGAPITSVAAGPAGHVFASTATKVYDFSSSGTLLNTFSGFANSGFADLSFFSETPASAVPEPSTMMLLTIGFAGISGYRWQRRCKHLSVVRNLKNGIFAAPASMSDR